MRALVALAAAFVALVAAAAPAGAAGCDPIDPSRCLYPWPNDHFREHGHLALTAVDDADERVGHADRAVRLQLVGRLQPRSTRS